MSPVVEASRWSKYADATRVEHFAWWAREHCLQSVGKFAGRPLELEPWQIEMVGEALAELGEDEAYWLTVALVIPKKNGKTSLLAAYALYHLLEDEGSPEILLAAATDKQAGRLFDMAVGFCRNDPWLTAHLVIREHTGEIARADGFGRLYRVSADSGAASGYGPSLVVADELADWTTPRRRRTWGNIATAGQMIRDQVHVFVISTAGEPHERVEGILGQMLDRNELEGDVERIGKLTISRNHAGRTLIYNYDAQTFDVGDLDAIKGANPASWVTRERLGELAASPTLTAGRFLQLHGCVWATAEAGFLTLEQWRGLAREGELAAGEEVFLGFRGGESASLVACRRRDGMLFTLGVFEPSDRAPIIDSEDVDDLFEWAVAAHQVTTVFASATPEWQTIVDGWRRDLGSKRVIDVDVARPSPRTAQIVQRFRADAIAERVHHDGDRRLARHLLAARLQRVRNTPYLAESSRHDSSIAAALAALLAWEANVVAKAGPDEPDREEYGFL